MAERKGLTAPLDPAAELQEIMRQEGRQEVSNEGAFLPSLEGGKEGRYEGTPLPAQEDRKETSNEGRRTGRKEGGKPPAREEWKEGVKARAKAGTKEQRKVRLNVDIPADIHLEMKLWCLREGYNLNELVPALIAAFMAGEE